MTLSHSRACSVNNTSFTLTHAHMPHMSLQSTKTSIPCGKPTQPHTATYPSHTLIPSAHNHLQMRNDAIDKFYAQFPKYQLLNSTVPRRRDAENNADGLDHEVAKALTSSCKMEQVDGVLVGNCASVLTLGGDRVKLVAQPNPVPPQRTATGDLITPVAGFIETVCASVRSAAPGAASVSRPSVFTYCL